MSQSDTSPSGPQPSYFARHGIAIAVFSALTCLLTVAAVLGVQRYLNTRAQESERTSREERRKQIEQALLGRWELIESTMEPVTTPGSREWMEFQKNGVQQFRWFQVTKVNGEVVSRSERFGTLAYEVADVDRLIYDPKGVRRQLTFVLDCDELTLDSNNGIEKSQRVKWQPHEYGFLRAATRSILGRGTKLSRATACIVHIDRRIGEAQSWLFRSPYGGPLQRLRFVEVRSELCP